MKASLKFSVVFAVGAVLSGCVVAPPHEQVYVASGSLGAAISPPMAIAQYGPPAPMREAPPPIVFERSVWIPGYWFWDGGRHVWRSGHYEVAPVRGSVWVPHVWVKAGGAWNLREGYWR